MGCGISKKPNVSKSRANSIPKNLKSSPELFITSNQKPFSEVYKLGTILGSGAYGEVKKVTHKVTGQERAVKIFRKADVNSEVYKLTKNEIDVLRKLNHPVIVKMYEFFEDQSRVYIVLEKCDGGELFYQISKRKQLSENTSAIIMKQLFSGLLYLHENHITHRDIKPENILLEDNDDLLNIKLVDFGTAIEIRGKKRLTEMVGSTYYISPEVINGDYDQACDMWSCGVILYILLSGTPPFNGNTTEQILGKICVGKYSIEGHSWKCVSASAKDLISRLLCPVSLRLTAEEALKHPWIQENGLFPVSQPTAIENAIENLKLFNSFNKFRDAISTFITSQILSAHETKDLREIFKSIDVNGDGKLSKEEMIKGFGIHNEGLDREDYIEKIIDEVDTDGNGFIDYNEFIKATISQKKLYSKENMRKAFDMFDLDGSGKISSVELQKIFSVGNVKDSAWKEVVKQADKNLDGEIDFEEFCEFITEVSNVISLN